MSGDVMHHPVQCAEPHWNNCLCVDEELSLLNRRAFLNRYADKNILIMPSHFPSPTVGRIISSGNSWRFVFESDK